jgi:hypothetical protein
MSAARVATVPAASNAAAPAHANALIMFVLFLLPRALRMGAARPPPVLDAAAGFWFPQGLGSA